MEHTMDALLARFGKRRVITEAGCWLYAGDHNSKGYPRVWLDKKHRSSGLHRLALAFSRGLDLDDPWQTRHTCESNGCWNPGHLEPGTVIDNLRDKWGVMVTDRKEEVDAMLAEGLSPTVIGERLGINRTRIYQYRNGKTYRGVV